MKRVNFNIKDRKILYGILAIVLVSVFTLTIAYAALNAVLTIQGGAQVSSADWNIHLANQRVTSGSATTEVPIIKTNSTLEFSTTLNMPGDFYEFVVDVVNDGTIDAMIENIIKTPELTAEQAKYLKYEISYLNDISITQSQLLPSKASLPIKVRIEFLKDIENIDLPSNMLTLSMQIKLTYSQAGASTVIVPGKGVAVADGSLNTIGTIVTIGTEKFYVIGDDGDNIKLLSMYNLHVGNKVVDYDNVTLIDNPTGLQDATARGSVWIDPTLPAEYTWIGSTEFASSVYWETSEDEEIKYVYNSSSSIYPYVENYKNYLTSQGMDIVEARLISYDELLDLGCDEDSCASSPQWLHSTSYWTGTSIGNEAGVFVLYNTGDLLAWEIDNRVNLGVRPVIVVSKDLFLQDE